MIKKSPAIEFKVENGLAIARMAQPKNRNAFTADFLTCIQEIIATCQESEEVTALILTGIDYQQ